jgi:DNA-binding HxlR family transcriptional regulator
METNWSTRIPLPLIDPYKANCPSRQVLDLIGDKWASLLILLLTDEPKRFSMLQRSIQGISQKMLTQTLRRLERDGLISRTLYPEVPLRVEYALTPLGETLCAPISALVNWAEEHIDEVSAAQNTYDARSTSEAS